MGGSQMHQDESRTTLTVKHIPKCTPIWFLLEQWPNESTYDLLFLPSYINKSRRLYAVVNFTNAENAAAFQQRWDGQRTDSSGAALSVSYSQTQGRAATLRVIQRKSLSHDDLANSLVLFS